MRRALGLTCFVLLSASSALIAAGPTSTTTAGGNQWSPTAARDYLDKREIWWQNWEVSQRDHQTVCISCHSALPYALARPSLRQTLKEGEPSPPEQFLLAGVIKRVQLWDEVLPFYTDDVQGAPKSLESRGTEAVLNALILANEDARTGHLSDITKAAFNAFWQQQLTTGKSAGAWTWLNFHLAPWESNTSEYYGAALAALAVGTAPENYSGLADIQPGEKLLITYLQREYDAQPLINKVAVYWASAKLHGLLTKEQKALLLQALYEKQQDDGGWTLTTLGPWKRLDNTALPTKSDGYSTGLIALAMEQNGEQTPKMSKAVAWLRQNQNTTDGFWPAFSLNLNRDPNSDRGKFMTDAATAYAVLALENAH